MTLSKEDDIEEMAKKWASVISDKYVRGQAEEAARILLRHGVEKLPELREADLGKIRKMQGMYAKFEQPMAEGFESKIYVNRQAYKQWKAGQEYAKKLGYAAQDNNILHELGHYVDYLNDPKTMRERFYQKIEGIDKDLVEKNLSKYALTNKCEFEAELNAAIMSGKVMPKEILDYSGMNSTKTPLAKRLLAYGAGKDVCLPNEDLRKKYKDAMKAMYHQEGSTFSIDILGNKDVQEFINAHATMLDNSFKQVKMTPKMRERLTRSDYIFSGMKAFHEMNEAFPSMVDENGDRKPFEKFLNDVRKLDEKYNANYLHSEYNFVAASATMAAKWEQFAEDGDRYYLQYRTAHDDKVRPEHAALDGVTLPMSDTFWETYYPPNGWNCRCDVVQVRKQKYPATDHKEAMERGEEAMNGEKYNIFRFNSGKQGKAMPDYNPYTIRRCNDCDIAKGKLPLDFVPEGQLCASCVKVRTCWEKKQKDAPEVFYECDTKRGKVRVSSKHGKTEKKENVRVATYLAEKYGYSIDLIANPSDIKTADSKNKSLGFEQEYKVSKTSTVSSIDRLIRTGKDQADNIVLSIESDISLSDIAKAFRDRVRRAKNIESITVILWEQQKDATYKRNEILSSDFKIRPEDFK